MENLLSKEKYSCIEVLVFVNYEPFSKNLISKSDNCFEVNLSIYEINKKTSKQMFLKFFTK